MSREDNIYYARLAEQGERYEDMIRYMKQVSNVSHKTSKTLTNRRCIITKIYNYCSKKINLKSSLKYRVAKNYQMRNAIC